MISLILPTFNEVENLPLLIEEINKVVNKIDAQFELIFIDDCSTDGSFAFLKSISRKDKRIKVIRFARNFGSHSAITAGLSFAKGSAAIVMASDLQDPPKIIPQLLAKWRKSAKIVWGVRERREGERSLTILLSRFYYKIVGFLTAVKMFPLGADVFLADRVVINEFKKIPEKHSSVFMVLSWLGFSQEVIYYNKSKRLTGKSKWTTSKKIKLVIDSILSFSDIPIRYGSLVGIITASLGSFYAVYTLYRYVSGFEELEGWSLVLIVLLIVSGVQMTILGVLGEYLWRTFDESRRRPRYIIEDTINIPNKSYVS